MTVEVTTLRERVEKNTILRCVAGSELFGLSLGESSDHDELGVCIEDIDDAMGIAAPFEQLVYRSAAEREGHHDAPSQAGDLDLTIYSLRKYLRMALKGNPTVVTLLFVPTAQCIRIDSRGSRLQELAPDIVSRQAGRGFLGYFNAQKQRLMGERGQMRVHRTDLVSEHGYDTKYAMHMLRLGFQGVELLNTGRLELPIAEPVRSKLLGVRRGEADVMDVLNMAGELEADLKALIHDSPLQEHPETEPVEQWMLNTYFMNWKARVTYDKVPSLRRFIEKAQ